MRVAYQWLRSLVLTFRPKVLDGLCLISLTASGQHQSQETAWKVTSKKGDPFQAQPLFSSRFYISNDVRHHYQLGDAIGRFSLLRVFTVCQFSSPPLFYSVIFITSLKDRCSVFAPSILSAASANTMFKAVTSQWCAKANIDQRVTRLQLK